MRLTHADWVKLVEEWHASGQSARPFATTHGVTDTALRYWAGRLAKEKALRRVAPSPRLATRESPPASSSPALARVVRHGEAPPSRSGGRIMVMVGKATVVVEPGFEEAHLRDVVRALSELG